MNRPLPKLMPLSGPRLSTGRTRARPQPRPRSGRRRGRVGACRPPPWAVARSRGLHGRRLWPDGSAGCARLVRPLGVRRRRLGLGSRLRLAGSAWRWAGSTAFERGHRRARQRCRASSCACRRRCRAVAVAAVAVRGEDARAPARPVPTTAARDHRARRREGEQAGCSGGDAAQPQSRSPREGMGSPYGQGSRAGQRSRSQSGYGCVSTRTDAAPPVGARGPVLLGHVDPDAPQRARPAEAARGRRAAAPLDDPDHRGGDPDRADHRQHRRLHRAPPRRVPPRHQRARLRQRRDAERLDGAEDLPHRQGPLPPLRSAPGQQPGGGADGRDGADHRHLLRRGALLLQRPEQRGEPAQLADVHPRRRRHRHPHPAPGRVRAPARRARRRRATSASTGTRCRRRAAPGETWRP